MAKRNLLSQEREFNQVLLGIVNRLVDSKSGSAGPKLADLFQGVSNVRQKKKLSKAQKDALKKGRQVLQEKRRLTVLGQSQ